MRTRLFKSFLVLSLLILSIGSAWGGAAYLSVRSADPAQGLVYCSSSNSSPTTDKFQEYHPGGCVTGTTGTDAAPANKCYTSLGSGNGPHNGYAWAKPARGYKFKAWSNWCTGTGVTANAESIRNTWDGTQDQVQTSAGGRQCTYTRMLASFEPADSYTITYAKPVGGSYTVGYSYLKTRERSTAKFYNASGTANSYKDYEFYTDDSESYSLSPSSDGNQAVTSYAEDAITMTASGTNFVGWYEGTTQKSTSASYTTYKASANVTITALFKLAILGDAVGDLSPSVAELKSYNYSVTIPVTARGTWTAGDFTVTFTEQTSPKRNDVTKGTVTYVTNSGNVLASNGTLTIPFTYNPTSWGNTEVKVTVTPASGGVYGDALEFTIRASAVEPALFQAEVWENGVKTNEGDLVDMVAYANTLTNNPTVKVKQDVTITSPLSLSKSMKFNLNDKTITCTAAKAFSIDAADIDVQIVDEGFSGNGTVAVTSAQSGNVNVVTFTQKAKLTMNGGTLSATNTGAGSAYGLDVRQGSVYYMTGGNLTVTAATDARGVNVATSSDYATFNGGSITVSALTNAYGLWSAGQGNITNATINVTTSTGTSAYGVYVNSGVSTIDAANVTVAAATTNAYGGYVAAGRLNVNGGSFAVTAPTSDVYGVYIAAGATANIQQNAIITAEATSASGTKVFGINNLGTVNLKNISVTATSPTTAATAVNSQTSAVSTTIEGGTYRANTTGGTAYGLHHLYGMLNVDGGTFRAIGSGNSIYGGRSEQNASIANATIYGETQGSGNTAYGFVGATAGKNITLTNCEITGLSVTSKAYAIYSRANVTATGCTLTATTGTNEAYGVYAENGTNMLINSNAVVTANTIQAYGVNHLNGTLTIEGGRFEVTAEQKTASTDEESKLYGIYNAAGKTATVTDAKFIVRAANGSYAKYMYGAYSLGILNSTNTVYDVKGKIYARGVYNSGTLNSQNDTIAAENTNGSDCYGIYATNKFTINGGEVHAKSNLKKVYAMTFGASADGDVLAGKFYAVGNGTDDFGAITTSGTIGKVRLKGGVYKTVSNLKRYAYTGLGVFNLDDTHPDYAAGYRYTIAAENPSPYVCYIKNGHKYATLAEALQYTKDNSGTYTIIMTQNHTLPAGDYELPSNATLIVPYKSGQETLATAPVKRNTAGLLEEHIRLTIANGANLNVNGKIEVGGELYCVESGLISYNNSPYGHIRMEEGSFIQLNSGARLYAWGFVTGAGNITVKNGAEVHEMFQIGDMPAMSPLVQHYNNNSYKFFPLNQYFIQNVEAATTYYYGSKLICSFSNYYTGSYNGDDNIKLVGTESSLFLITSTDESSWVRKRYDAAHDYQVWEVNSDIKLGSLSLSVSGYSFNSSNYILPVTSNMKIHVLDGDFAITQSTQFLPGTQLEVNKTASLTVNSGQKVYVFDKDQWPLSAKTIAFSPSWTNGAKPSRTSLFVDAALNIHGKIDVKGSIFTSNKGTTTKTDGANIYSTNADAGTVSYNAAAPSATTITLMTSGTATTTVNVESAKLKNGDGSYTETAGTGSGEAFIYVDNRWQKTYTNGCFEVIGSTVYAKPSEFVALKKSQTVGGKLTGVEETNHTYLTAADKILILMDDCQWWEVEETEDPAVFECKKEGYEGFYYYNTSTGKWQLKTVTVTFYSAETGNTTLKTITTDWKGIPDQAVIASNPTKATTAEYTYTFYGWKSSVTGNTYHWTATLEPAQADMNYRPVFTATKRNYTITLNNANNGETVYLEVPYGEMPEYTPKKDATAQYTYTFNGWNTPFVEVTGTATYTAQWNQVTNRYNITWMNGDDELEVDENQAYGATTAYNGATPTKEMDDDYVYTFSKWKSSLNGNEYNNGSTPTVAGTTTYSAQYTTTRRYAVTFNNYDGTQLARTIYTQGQTPTYDGLPTRPRDYDGYFRFDGWKNSAGTKYNVGATLPAVTAKETYTAQYVYVTDMFTITLNNVDGNGATWSGKFGEGSTPFYNPNDDDVPVTPAKAGDINHEYTFSGWSPALQPVTANATYTAQFEEHIRKYNITWIIDGVSTTEKVEYGATPSHANPTKDPTVAKTYTFTGWSPAITAVSGDATYTAQFSETTRKYDITWVIDGVSTTEQVAYGTKPTHVNPTKDATAQYTYTFTGWDPAIATVSGDATYTAQFNSTVNKYSITWVDGDGNTIKTDQVEYGTVPNYTGSNPTKTSTAQYEYTFTNWDVTPVAVTGAATYTAQFSSTTRTYTIRFANVDGNGAYEEVVVAYGGTPVCPVVPEKVNGAYEYEFLGWNTPIVAVTGPATYTATYSSTPTERKYTITWLNDDNSLIENTRVLWNVVPTHADPSKAATAQYTYTFAGWDPTPVAVTGPATYKATFNATVNQYEVSFNLQYHGLAILPQTKDYGAKIDQPANPSATGWTFGGWYKEAECTHAWNFNSDVVQGATTLYAKWTINTHNLTWNWDGGETSSTTHTTAGSVAYDTELVYPANNTMTKAGHTFAGWSSTPSGNPTTMPDADLTITALWNVNKYTVTWKNYDGSTLETDTEVPYNTTPTYNGSTPAKPQTTDMTFAFTGWSPAISPVADDITYTAQFSESARLYTITWIINGVSTTEQVAYGTVPTHADPEKVIDNCKYDFLGWDVTPVAVTGDATYTATFSDECTQNNFLVVFQNYDGTPLYAAEVKADDTPEYQGQLPTKPSGEGVYYEFNGWSPAVGAISDHTVYTAQYTSKTAVASVTTSPAGVTTPYTSWSDALTAANQNNNCTLRIYTDVTATNNSSINQNMTIDLNGHTISGSTSSRTNPRLFYLNNKALTIEDSKEGGSIYYEGTSYTTYYAIYVEGTGSVTVNNGTIQANATYLYNKNYDNYNGKAAAICLYSTNATLNMRGGKLVGSHSNNNGKAYTVYHRGNNYGYANVYGGKLNAKTSIFYNQSAARVQLTGGYYSMDPGNTVTIPNTHQKVNPTEIAGYTHKVVKKTTTDCTVIWKDEDGTQIDQTTIKSGQKPSHDDPTKPEGELHKYEFAGWTPALGNIENDMTYTATYHLKIKIGWNVDGNITPDWVRFGEMPSYTGATPTRAATAQYSYTFTGWEPEIEHATCPKTYTAQFDEELRSYTITFANLDGNNTKQQVGQFAYGATPVCTETPLKEEGGKAYEFLGWSPAIVPVTADATYTATFSDTPSLTVYTITWKDDQGNTIETTKVAEDELPTHAAPVKANTDEYTYTFTGWSPAVVPATADATYQATFSSVKNKYTITFKDYDGTVLQSELMEYGTTPSISNPTREAYNFNGWSPAIGSVTADATYTATYTFSGNVASVTNAAGTNTQYYTTWASALSAANGSDGCTLRIHTDIAVETYQQITQNMTIDLNGYTLSRDGAGNTLLAIPDGNNISLIIDDSRGGGGLYLRGSASSICRALSMNAGSVTIKGGTIHAVATANNAAAVYLAATNATLNLNNGTLIAEATNGSYSGYAVYSSGTNYGYSNIYGGKLKAKTAIFYNHSTARTRLQGGYYSIDPGTNGTNLTIATGYGKQDVTSSEPEYAEGYVKKVVKTSCVVTWNNYDGTELRVDEVAGGSTPTYDGATPTHPATAQYEYVFAGWDPEVSAITDDIIYTAQFTETLRSYTITWADGDGNELATDEVEYGQIPAYTGLSTPTKTATAEYSYIFNSTWSPTPYAVDKAETYTAQFTPKKNKYNIIWVDGDGNTLRTDKVEYGATPVYDGETPTKTEDANYTYTFNSTWSPAITSVTGDATYTAQFDAVSKETGFYADIIDVDNSAKTLKLNVSGTEWVTAGWPYEVNGTVYYRDQAKATAAGSDKYRATDRTLTIPYTGEPGENFTVTIRNASSTLVSKHTYIIPQEIKSATTLTTDQTAPIFVKGATLTVNADIEAMNIYVGHDAKLVINSGVTLTADSLFLRTKPESAAELVINELGTIAGTTKVVYTRIILSKSGYFQFGLPLSCPISAVRLSNGNTVGYKSGSGWILRYYDEYKRATTGPGDNWATLDAAESIAAGRGYEMYSGVDYYREFYFPVDLSALTNTVHVDYTASAQPTNNGWNVLVSPLTHTYTQTPQPEMNISWMQLDGSFLQEPLTTVAPAMTFAYQAAKEGSIVFDGSSVTVPTLVPRRRVAAVEEPQRIQWMHLDIKDANGVGDQTSVYSHPTRYAQTFQSGIDEEKQSLTATRALIYSSHAYGEMAFAGVSDELLEQGVALTVYSPKAQELTISMRENDWLNRMAFVWLIDQATGAQIDLLESDYSFNAEAGTTAGRFILMGAFFAPQITTDNGTVQSDDEDIKAKKFIYNDKMYIQINGVIYDATGKLVK